MTTRSRLRTTYALVIVMTVAGISWTTPNGDANHQDPPTVTVDGADWQRDLTTWAVDRFQATGLTLPSVHVSFHTSLDECAGYIGLATTGTSPAEIRICRRGGARKVLLHELAHVWAHELPNTIKTSFVELIGASSWNSGGEWHQQGSEHAAEIMAWALLEGNNNPYTGSFQEFSSVDNEEAFEILTGQTIPKWDGDITTPWDATAETVPTEAIASS